MSKILGIIGGGQLGMMLTEAAQNLDDISKIIVLDPTENCPAAKVGAQQIIADFKDEDAIKKLSELSDIICLLYTSPSPRDRSLSRMPSSA